MTTAPTLPARPNRSRLLATLLAAGGLAATACQSPAAPPGRPESKVALRVDGPDLVDANGEVVTLKAINLGNWFLIEAWMYAQSVADQATFINVLRARFGDAQAEQLMRLHYLNYITQRDFDQIAASGFNCVRIPLSHIVVEPEPWTISEEGMGHLRRAMEMAANAGLYVIVDMHSTPGGQSTDQPSGDVTQNNLWTDPEAQERLAWIWQHIARRFKDQENFVAYDLINEPFSNYQDDIRDELIPIVDRCIEAIRLIDEERLIFVPGTIHGISFYGSPADRGWTNTGITEHAYPGIFDGQPATLSHHARFITVDLRHKADYVRSLGSPYLLGEFNPVFDHAGAHETARAYFDAAEDLGIHAAIWSHKIVTSGGGVGGSNWYLVTNEQPLGLGDIRTASLSTITGVFTSHAFAPLAVDQGYVDAMTADPAPQVLPQLTLLPLEAPAQDEWSGWSFADVGSVARPGGQAVINTTGSTAAEELTLYTGGLDLYNFSDSIRLASTRPIGNFVISGIVDAFDAAYYGHAGVTIRASEAANAPHVSLYAHTNGRIVVKNRPTTGAWTNERYVGTAGFPVGLALGRINGTLRAWMTDDDGVWTALPLSESPAVGSAPRAGVFASANREGPLSVVTTRDLRLDPSFPLTGSSINGGLHQGPNLLTNAGFETPGPSGWYLGSNWSRETNWTPRRDGSSLLAYRHWEVSNSNASYAYQDVSGLTAGREYTLTVYANRDQVAGGRSLADRIDLKVETVENPRRDLEVVSFDVEEIATGSDWSRLQVRFVATKTTHRVVLTAHPGDGQRDGAVKFDGLVLEATPDSD